VHLKHLMGQWKIVGGADKGGILVRKGEGLKSPQCPERLSTGAIVEELGVAGERLNYKLVTGTGPPEGWVTIRFESKILAERLDEDGGGRPDPPPEPTTKAFWTIKPDDEIPSALPAPPRPAHLPQLKPLPPWYKPSGKTAAELIKTVAKGELYGIEFPFSLKMLQEGKWGATWLTKAFHAAGTMSKSNKVVKIQKVVELPMSGYDAAGGAGMKGFLTVQYAKESPDLHTELFVKVPFGEEDNMTWRMNMSFFGDPDGGEISAYQFLTYLLPFRTPKMYFADIARSTTNYIIITEKIPFSKKGTQCQPYEIHPTVGKYQDYEMKDPASPYYALMRAMARFAAWDKQGRFESVRHIFEATTYARMGGRDKVLAENAAKAATKAAATQEQIDAYRANARKEMVAGAAKTWKRTKKHVETTVRFVSEIAPWMFPQDVKEKEFLDSFVARLELVNKLAGPIHMYCNDGDYSDMFFGLCHPNLQVDNAFFWTDEEGVYHAGLLDWGGCGYMSYMNVFLGCVSGALPDVYLEHEEKWFRTFADEFKRFGGGDMDPDELVKQSRLMFCTSVLGTCSNVAVQALSLCTEEEWKGISSKQDEKVMGNWNVRCQALAAETCIPVWRRGPHWKVLLDFCKEMDIPTEPF